MIVNNQCAVNDLCLHAERYFKLCKIHLQQRRVSDVHHTVAVYVGSEKCCACEELEFRRVALNGGDVADVRLTVAVGVAEGHDAVEHSGVGHVSGYLGERVIETVGVLAVCPAREDEAVLGRVLAVIGRKRTGLCVVDFKDAFAVLPCDDIVGTERSAFSF